MSLPNLSGTANDILNACAPYVGGIENTTTILSVGCGIGMLIYTIAFIFRTKLPGSGRVSISRLVKHLKTESFSVASRMHPMGEEEFFSWLHTDCKTLTDIFIERGMGKFTQNGANPAVGSLKPDGKIDWITYKDFRERIMNLSSGILKLGIKLTDKPMFAGIIGRNRALYLLAEHTLLYMGIICAHLTDSFGMASLRGMLLRIYPTLVVVEDPEKLPFVLDFAPKRLKLIITCFPLESKHRKKGIKIRFLNDLEELGKKRALKKGQFKGRSELHSFTSIYFTANHSELLRGVLLSHGNFLGAITGMAVHLDDYSFYNKDVYFAYLPRRIVMEGLLQNFMLMEGGRVIYYSGNEANLFDQIRAARPTVMLTVPRLLNQIFDTFALSALGKSPCVNFALCGKIKYLRKGDTNLTIVDRLLFLRLRSNFGGNLRLMIVTGGPIKPEVLTFTRAILGCVVLTNYGTAETCGTGIISIPTDNRADSTGMPLPCCQVRIVEGKFNIPETVEKPIRPPYSPIGEISIRGVNVAKQYAVLKGGAINMKKFDCTLLVGDARGYFRTNDLGRLYRDGTIQILCRKNGMVRNCQAQWICPDVIEKVLEKKCKTVKQICVLMPRFQNWAVGVVFFNGDEIRKSKAGKIPNEQISTSEDAKTAVVEDIVDVGRASGFQVTQLPFDVVLVNEKLPTSRSGDGMTKDRGQIMQTYKTQIEQAYNSLGTYDSLYGIIER